MRKFRCFTWLNFTACTYRKFTADYIFTGKDFLPGNNVLVTNEKGFIKDIVGKEEAGNDIEIFEGIISPGFINCHCHLELSHLKNVVEEGTGLIEFLMKVITNRKAVKEEIDAAMFSADKEMYDNGIVAVGDISNSTDTISTKQQSKITLPQFY